MADSIAGLVHTSESWLMEPNWADRPRRDYSLAGRDVLQEPGTPYLLREITGSIPHKWTYTYLLHDKSLEYETVYFFAHRRGKHRRFWTPVWQQAFMLYDDVQIFDDFVDIVRVRFTQTYQGYERLFMLLNDGSLITHHITAANDIGAYERLSVGTVFDRDIVASDIAYFGRFMLARLDTDTLEMSHEAAHVSKCTLDFIELVGEYSLGAEEES